VYTPVGLDLCLFCQFRVQRYFFIDLHLEFSVTMDKIVINRDAINKSAVDGQISDTYFPNDSPSSMVSGSFLFNVSGKTKDMTPPISAKDPKMIRGKGPQNFA
jgi:hypothetical protein